MQIHYGTHPEHIQYILAYRKIRKAVKAREKKLNSLISLVDRQTVISYNFLTQELRTRSREYTSIVPNSFSRALPETY